MNDQTIENEIRAKGKTAPRITPADIEANIACEHYFTASQAISLTAGITPPAPLDLLTFCVLVLRNGFTVTGESACASPENFDAEIGRKVARANAVQKIWPLLGYQLRSMLARKEEATAVRSQYSGLAPHQQRVVDEKAELDAKRDRLRVFIAAPDFEAVPADERSRLVRQDMLMSDLSEVLAKRIESFAATT